MIKLLKDLNRVKSLIPIQSYPRLHLLPIELYQDKCRVYLDDYEKVEILALEEAYDIIDKYNRWEDASCSCHIGNPPCGRCVSMPDEDTYNKALKTIETLEKEEER